jgi:hypothetical protein
MDEIVYASDEDVAEAVEIERERWRGLLDRLARHD